MEVKLISLYDIKNLIDNGISPIVHYPKKLLSCNFCCPIDNELLTQCKHYLIVENYFDSNNWIQVRMITNSEYFNNSTPKKDQYFIYKKDITVEYYTENSFILPYECLGVTNYYGYFIYL